MTETKLKGISLIANQYWDITDSEIPDLKPKCGFPYF